MPGFQYLLVQNGQTFCCPLLYRRSHGVLGAVGASETMVSTGKQMRLISFSALASLHKCGTRFQVANSRTSLCVTGTSHRRQHNLRSWKGRSHGTTASSLVEKQKNGIGGESAGEFRFNGQPLLRRRLWSAGILPSSGGGRDPSPRAVEEPTMKTSIPIYLALAAIVISIAFPEERVMPQSVSQALRNQGFSAHIFHDDIYPRPYP